MSIELVCPWCSKKIAAPDSMAGQTAPCPGCKGIVTVPFAPAPLHDPFAPPPDPFAPPQESIGPPPGFDFPTGPASGGLPSSMFGEEDDSGEPPPDEADGQSRRPCPICSEMILTTAIKCRYCGEMLDGSLTRALTPRRQDEIAEMTGVDWFFALLCPPVGCIAGFVRLISGHRSAGKMIGISFVSGVVLFLFLALIGAITDHAPRR